MKRSIRSRLLLTLLLAISSIWVVVIAYTYYGTQREVREIFDTQLEESARVATRTLLGLPLNEAGASGAAPTASGGAEASGANELRATYQKHMVVQVWDQNGELFLRSQSAPLTPLSDIADGFRDSNIDGAGWRTYSFSVPERGVTVKVGEPYQARDSLTQHVVQQTLYPLLLGLPILAILIWFAVGRGLIPLHRIAAEVAARDSDNLDILDTADSPDEVTPLIRALNDLLERLESTLDKERRFTADAAHELRTPLAGLKTQAQVALGASASQERNRAILNLLRGVDRGSHLVEQLLTLSRLDQAAPMPIATVDLAATVRTVMNDLQPKVEERRVRLDLSTGGGTHVLGNADAVYVLVRNLVDNAIRHSPPDAAVELSIARQHETIVFGVRDRGPGIPEPERRRVLERFYRGNAHEGEGSGLGLSIVKRIADLHRARLELTTPDAGGGLLATVAFVPTGVASAKGPDIAPSTPRDDSDASALQPSLG